MKYPVGTKCWVVKTDDEHRQYRGSIVTVTGHEVLGIVILGLTCGSCYSGDHMVETDAGPSGCCLCNLVPIDDPDAAVETREEEELSA